MSKRLLLQQQKEEKQPILRDLSEHEEGFVGTILGVVIVILVASAVIGVVANNSAVAEANADTDTKTDSIIDLWPFMFAIAILLGVVKIAM